MRPSTAEASPPSPPSSTLAARSGCTGGDVLIALNSAGHKGGGLYLEGASAYVYPRSAPTTLGATFLSNRAEHGGAVAVEPGGDLWMGNHVVPVRVHDNLASASGGAFYVRANDRRTAGAVLLNFVVSNNVAPDGAALYMQALQGMTAYAILGKYPGTNPTAPPTCRADSCNLISNNRAATTASGGSIITTTGRSNLIATGVSVLDNEAPSLVFAVDEARVDFRESVLAKNAPTADLIRAHGPTDIVFTNSTVVRNSLEEGWHVISHTGSGGSIIIHGSIVDAAADALIDSPSQDVTVEASVGPGVAALDPAESVDGPLRFVDEAFGDFSLRAGSTALEHTFAAFDPGSGISVFDRIGSTRTVEIDGIENRFGARDAGAFERPGLLPLVENGHFPHDLRAWQLLQAPLPGTPIVAFLDKYDASHRYDVPGFNSLRVMVASGLQEVVAARQCIHLPLPGRYSLHALALTDNHFADQDPYLADIPSIEWVYRRDGSESCEGAVTRRGEMFFAPGTTGQYFEWRLPLQNEVVEVFPGEWTENTSVELLIKVKGPAGHDPTRHNLYSLFDNIDFVLSSSPKLFTDGFEP
jgi:hypothetical protein